MGNDKRMSPKKESDKREKFLKSRDVQVPVEGDSLITGELARREVFATPERGRLKGGKPTPQKKGRSMARKVAKAALYASPAGKLVRGAEILAKSRKKK